MHGMKNACILCVFLMRFINNYRLTLFLNRDKSVSKIVLIIFQSIDIVKIEPFSRQRIEFEIVVNSLYTF